MDNFNNDFNNQNWGNAPQPDAWGGSQVPIQTGEIASRSGNVFFYMITYLLVFIPSFIFTILLWSWWGPTWGIIMLLWDLYDGAFAAYYTWIFIKHPKSYITFDGTNLIINQTRSLTVTINPANIIGAQGRNGNWMLHGWWWMADGTLAITTTEGEIRLPFTTDSIATAQMIMNIRNYAQSRGGQF